MPARSFSGIDINLIGADDFSRTPIGRVVTWATTYGRYIMILTEIVVLLAFISRFTLDRKLTDLNEEISQKQAIIEANAELETRFRTLQQKLSTIGKLIQTQDAPVQILGEIAQSLPPDTYLEGLEITHSEAKMTVLSGTTQGISGFLASLKENPQFADIQIGDISSQVTGGTKFEVTIKLAGNQQANKR